MFFPMQSPDCKGLHIICTDALRYQNILSYMLCKLLIVYIRLIQEEPNFKSMYYVTYSIDISVSL